MTDATPLASEQIMRDTIAKIINPDAFRPSFLASEFERLGVGVSPKVAAYATADRILAALSATSAPIDQDASQAQGEPFGYWIEQKGAEPALLRKPAYIPEPSALRTVTPLYVAPGATAQDGAVVENEFTATPPAINETASDFTQATPTIPAGMVEAEAKISRLEAALEWALDHADSEYPHYPERALPRTAYNAWQYPYLMSGPVQGGVAHATFPTALEAVEAAKTENRS